MNGKDPLTDIAVTGLAFEFPHEAVTTDAFWQMLQEGRSASTDFPMDRLNIDGFYHPDTARTSTLPVRGGHFVKEDLKAFDAPFFSITRAEAECMDPQQRRMLEVAFLALEDAGVPIKACAGSNTSVYTGSFTNDYLSILQQDITSEQSHAATGVAPSMLANRVSWFFDFKGPSMNLDSACSSSLVALHLACQDLRAGKTSMALVGGSNYVYHPNFMKFMTNFNFLSPDSRSWSFDQRANGYARGEGTAVIILKRLPDALRDGDTIRAVIRNTGSNQDGRTRGITQPSGRAQTDLISNTYRDADLDMTPTRFFEAHGTGTLAGDPIEANAIGAAFGRCRSSDDPLFIGAVKSNIGHLEGCSGLAGVIKTILVLEKGIVPPIAGFKTVNDGIDAHKLRLCFPTEPTPWPTSGLRRACVNSFGFGGTNATAVLDDTYHYLELRRLQGYHQTHRCSKGGSHANPVQSQSSIVSNHARETGIQSITMPEGSTAYQTRVLVWSASDEKSAVQLNDGYRTYLKERGACLDQLAYALAVRRSHLLWRSFTVLKSGYQSTPQSSSVDIMPPRRASDDQSLAFIFTGQGAQYMGMGRELLAYQAFQQSISESEKVLKQLCCPFSLCDVIRSDTDPSLIDRPEYSQTLTTCLQIALVDLLGAWGVFPSVVLGHSSGEIAAAFTAGALSRSSAVKVAYHRGVLSSKLAHEASGMTMTAAGISKDEAQRYLDELGESDGVLEVAIGCVNSPKSVTLTGRARQLAKLEKRFAEKSIFARRLRVPLAYHSKFMTAIAKNYHAALGSLERRDRTDPKAMLSSVTGDLSAVEELSQPDYWVRNMTSTVEFDAAFSRLLSQSTREIRSESHLEQRAVGYLQVTRVLEIGPHCQLKGPVRDILSSSSAGSKPTYMPSLIRNQDASVALLNSMGSLHCSGYPVDLLRINCLGDSGYKMPTNMPRYPFNHGHLYWTESRLSRNLRFSQVARHDLLGARSLDWNRLMAQWRNVLRLTEMPWLEDHQVSGQVILPAAAMVAIATEALRQLIEDGADIRGVQLRNTSFFHPIKFPQGSGTVETQVNLSTSSPASREHNEFSQFRIFAFEGESYVECCNGLIRAVEAQNDGASSPPPASFTRGRSFDYWTTQTSDSCPHPIEGPYAMPAGAGIEYGPCFQNVERLRIGNAGEATAEVNTEAWRSRKTSSFAQEYAMHPSNLDGLVQLIAPALTFGGRDDLPAMVPVRAANIWVACGRTRSLQTQRLRAFARCRLDGFRGAAADLVGTVVGESRPIVYMEGLETSFISAAISPDEKAMPSQPLCTCLSWKPDIDLMTCDQLNCLCTSGRPSEPKNSVQRLKGMVLAITTFIHEALQFVEHHSPDALPQHLKAYVSWMKYQRQRLLDGELLVTQEEVRRLMQEPTERERLMERTQETDAEGRLLMHVGRNLIAVLRDGVDPLNLIFGSGLADPYYEQALGNSHHAYPASVLVEALCFKNPSMNILEVGAGTGGQTLRTLETMASGGIKRWNRYDFTDISTGFVEQAKRKFQEYADQMDFRVCDISKDPVSQSLEAGRYDLVIASHVLHATVDLDQSLRNIKKLLRPGGRFLLFETTSPQAIHIPFAFGLLKDWWSPLDHEARSLHSPCLTSQGWDERLIKAGFSGVELDISGQEQEQCRCTSIIFSTKKSQLTNGAPKALQHIAVVRDPSVGVQRALSTLLEQHLNDCKSYSLEELAEVNSPAARTMTVFLVEMNATLLNKISASDFGCLKAILSTSKTTIWVTQSTTFEADPWQHLVEGMGRSLASEDSTRKFVNLALESSERDFQHVANLISKLTVLVSESSVEDLETDYVSHGGVLTISRVVENKNMDDTIAEKMSPRQQRSCQPLPDLSLSLTMSSPGFLDTLEFREDAHQESPISGDEINVDVRAFGLTFQDYRKATGQLKDVRIGTECAGIVRIAGESSGFRSGDRVCVIGAQTSRSTLNAKAGGAVLIPCSMSFSEAASVPSALWLAYHALVDVARLEAGETVLIHQATSCVGQMAMQVARTVGARVLVTLGSPSGSSHLSEEIRIPAEAIFSHQDEQLSTNVYAATSGMGVDVVLGAFSGDEMEDLSVCLSFFGRLVDISGHNHGQLRADSLGSVALGPNTSRASIDLVELLQKKPHKAHEIFQHAMKFFRDVQLKPPGQIHIFGANEIQAAFRSFQDRDVIGKRVVDLDPAVPILANVKTKPKCCFGADGTYVIGGGLGGLGRSLARWMAERGARHLILLSRRGIRGDAARGLVDQLRSRGVRVATPPCDIGDFCSLSNVLKEAAAYMPPIQGCIQATVALRDNLFDKMTHEDWELSSRSKVLGSWNLHAALPPDLDFFVLISSLHGIFGGRAQANYSAGNTFKDALAHHRISRRQKAVSIDLGLMADEGFAAENEHLLKSMRRLGHFVDVRREQLLALMDHYCDARLPLLSHADAQVLVGIRLPSAIVERGIDVHHSLQRPMFRHLYSIDASLSTSGPSNQSSVVVDRAAVLRAAASEEEAAALVTEWFSAKLGQSLGLSPADVDARRPVHAYGVDSLAAIDLRNWFQKEVGADVAVFEVLGNQSVAGLSAMAAAGGRRRS